MTNNRTLQERDKLNPDVGLIRKTSSTNTERGWQYIKLLIKKSGVENPTLETWLNTKYHKLEEMKFLEVTDTRPIAAALFYLACVKHGAAVTMYDIREILKPIAQPTLIRKIKLLRELL